MAPPDPTGNQGPQKAERALWKTIAATFKTKRNTFVHTPIDYHNDIRILRIYPREDDGDLKCQLLPSALPAVKGQPPESKYPCRSYVALSYCWGKDEASKPVQLYDEGTRIDEYGKEVTSRVLSGVFHIRENLEAALLHCRGSQPVNVWVDAICINQENLVEKAAQVSRMHEVYSDATEVYVWLGAGRTEDEKRKIRQTFQFLREIIADLRKLDRIDSPESDQARSTNLENLILVAKLIRNPWFGRRWIIQELALARKATIRWDGEQLGWSEFVDAISLLMTKHAIIKDILRPTEFGAEDWQLHDPRALGASTLIDATSNLFRRTDEGSIHEKLMSLEVLVSSLFLPFESSDPKDTIYAVLSLSKDSNTKPTARRTLSFVKQPKWYTKALYGLYAIFEMLVKVALLLFQIFMPLSRPLPKEEVVVIDERIAVDYDKPLVDTCADFMEYCIEQSKSLDILCRHWVPGPRPLTFKEQIMMQKPNYDDQADRAKSGNDIMPSWILCITGHAYGGPQGVYGGRINADSLVGGFERQNKQYYNASAGLLPCVQFGKTQSYLKRKGLAGDENTKPNPTSPVGLEDLEDVPGLAEKAPKSRSRKFDDTLKIKGKILGEIDKISDQAAEGVIPGKGLAFGGLKQSPKTQEGPPDFDFPDRLWRTLVADRGPEGTIAPAWYRRACLQCLKKLSAGGDLNTEQFMTLPNTPTAMKAFISRVRAVVWKRRFFLTKEKPQSKENKEPIFGLAPGDAEKGDQVCILFGCSVPVVLRRVRGDRSKTLYSFVGECYAHGKMDGEAIGDSQLRHPYPDADVFTLI
jgi:hypothetical protein